MLVLHKGSCSNVRSILSYNFNSVSLNLCSVSLQPRPENAVTVAVSSRVLFRTEKEQKVYEQQGIEEYLQYQIEHENEPFEPGPALPFVKVSVRNVHIKDRVFTVCPSELTVLVFWCSDRL